ncbi:GNAT family N-acetyltransferase [Natronoglomus mannanivorans]|uniref:GNAT family N-acetyltransferase n=1 Tax=Natronoglomus mannanivorans TaxID=2979990 RepID=A0AAP2Z385_9EURY|nr:GNAT family N-acetyltransferase [Halobacteria archaeon AArc-xg1-1]
MTGVCRRATVSDATAVRTVARESWHAAYSHFLERETIDSLVDDWYAVDGLEASITEAAGRADAVFLVAEGGCDGDGDEEYNSDTDLVGFVHVVPKPDDRTVVSLVRLYVHPDCWGEGIGTVLVERALDELETSDGDAERRGLEVEVEVEVEVFAENEVGVRFYESRGFERVGEREEAFAGDTQTVYTYERSLEEEGEGGRQGD